MFLLYLQTSLYRYLIRWASSKQMLTNKGCFCHEQYIVDEKYPSLNELMIKVLLCFIIYNNIREFKMIPYSKYQHLFKLLYVYNFHVHRVIPNLLSAVYVSFWV